MDLLVGTLTPGTVPARGAPAVHGFLQAPPALHCRPEAQQQTQAALGNKTQQKKLAKLTAGRRSGRSRCAVRIRVCPRSSD